MLHMLSNHFFLLAEGTEQQKRRDIRNMSFHQDHVGSFRGDFGTSAEIHSDTGLCQSEFVVDTVTDHFDDLFFCLRLANLCNFAAGITSYVTQ